MKKQINKITDMEQIDGRVHNDEHKITRVEQIMNANAGLLKYGTTDIDEFAKTLSLMNTAELRTFAISKAGVVPGATREKLVKQLISKFKQHTTASRRPQDHVDSNVSLSKEKLDSVLNILKHVK